jgi:CO/xanthine dehydrogenase Mo-binding subunit
MIMKKPWQMKNLMLEDKSIVTISTPIKRFDFDDKINGQVRYCADIKLPGMLYARTLRSDKARAKILSIDIPPLPQGYYIVDHRDIPGKNIVPIVYDDQPFFAADKVNYIGEPIMLVVGEDKQIILDIIQSITINYEILTPVLNIAEAELCQTEFIFGEKPWFVEYEFAKGDLDKAIKTAKHFIEDEFRTGLQEQAYLETQSMLAAYENNRITVYGSMQCPYYIDEALLQALDWPQERIRVVQLPTGGGFGGKEEFPSIIAVHAALAAIKSGHPVQLIYDRQEDIVCSTKRHPAIVKYKTYVDDQGRIIGREVDIKTDGGAYAGLSSVVLQRLMFSANGVYDIASLKVRGRAYATNNVVSGAFRGFGGPQAFFAAEVHMENIARQLNIDALDFRSRHFFKQGDNSSTGGKFKFPIKLNEILERATIGSNYVEKRNTKPGNCKKLNGIGLSVFFHGCGFTGSGEQELIKPKVLIRKYVDDSVQIFVSSTEIGQGELTTLRKIAAQTLQIPIEKVKQEYPDTDTCPNSGPTVASRTTMIVGKLVEDCCRKIKARWHEPEFEILEQFVYPSHLYWDKVKFEGNAYPEYSWGANVVEVEVDPLTYEVLIIGVWGVYDIGTPIDEKIVQGQLEGGIVQGLGYAALESMTTINGRILQDNLANYIIPTALDFPPAVIELINNPYPNGPFGARGLGELPHVGTGPALALAVQHAIGKKVTRLPVTPEYIMELIKNDEHR